MAATPTTFDYWSRADIYLYQAKSSTTVFDYFDTGDVFRGVIQISAVSDPVFPNAVSVP